MHSRVALQVVALIALPEQAERLPGGPEERRVRGQRDRDVDVEDLLADALVGVLGRPEDRERKARDQESRRCQREEGGAVIP